MRSRFIYSLTAFLFCSLGGVVASPIDDMASAVDSLGRYEVEFNVVVNGESVGETARYEVDGGVYYLNLIVQEVYGSEEQRCTIDHANKEVILERIEQSSEGSNSLIIVNPASAFDSLVKEFNVETLVENQERILLKLTPRSERSVVDSSLIELNPTTNLPRAVSYISEGDVIMVQIEKIQTSKNPIKELQYPDGYEVIDIR